MLKLPEAVAMMDPAPGYSKQRGERRAGSSLPGCDEGYHISYPLATLLILLFCSGLLLTGFIVYLVRPCGTVTQLLPVVKPAVPPQSLELEGVSNPANGSLKTTQFSTPVTTPSTASTATTEDNAKVDDWPPIRLPNSIVPDHYKIDLIPFLANNWTFHGLVQIRLNVTEPTSNVTLHTKDLQIDNFAIKLKAVENSTRHRRAADPQIDKIETYPNKDLLVIHSKELLEPGRQLDLIILFKGEIKDDLKGLYRSSYSVNNETRWLVVTLFQATYARSAFPCFDEPKFKAVFHLRLGRPLNMSSLSNMPLKNEDPEPIDDVPDYVWDVYEPTLPMSTYLFSFAVTDFASKTKNKITVWARAEAINQSDYALEISEKALDFYERYFGIPYPLPKMDILALPDFEVGAMENWGLITARESMTLVDDMASTPDSILAVARVMAHEIAHQWFGNLVTPWWWSDIWLNEGFATYMEGVSISKIEPDFISRISDVEVVQDCMSLDFGSSAHPISQKVDNPLEIDSMFDHISYQKGASVIRMMDHFLSPEVFQDGVNSYLQKQAYSTATQNDLWESLTQAARKKGRMLEGRKPSSVREVMDTWTLQGGYPVLTIIRDYENGGANLTQMPFSMSSNINVSSDSVSVWQIPVSYTTQAQPDLEATWPRLWVTSTNQSIEDLEAHKDHWAIFNLQQTGYYRVNYDKRNWKLLITHLQNPRKFKQLDAVTRSQLIDDSFTLAQTGLLEYDIPLELSRYLRLERELLPWQASLRHFSYLSLMAKTTGKYNRFRRFMLGLLEPTYNHLGFYKKSNDKQEDAQLRNRILEVACAWEHEACLREAVYLYQRWQKHATPDTYNPIPSSLKSIVYCTAIEMGNDTAWDFAWQRYLNSNLASEREELLGAMGCSRQTWILRRYLEWALDPESEIRRQDIFTVFSSVASREVGRNLVYQIVADKWDEMEKYFDDQQATTTSLILSSSASMNTKYQLEMVQDFISKRNDTRDLYTHFKDIVKTNIDWMDRYFNIIDSWLKTTLQNYQS